MLLKLQKGRDEFINRGIDVSRLEHISQGDNCAYEPQGKPSCFEEPSNQANQGGLAQFQGSFPNVQDQQQPLIQGRPPLFMNPSQGEQLSFAQDQSSLVNKGQRSSINRSKDQERPPQMVSQNGPRELCANTTVIEDFDTLRVKFLLMNKNT